MILPHGDLKDLFEFELALISFNNMLNIPWFDRSCPSV